MIHRSQSNARGSWAFETKWNWIICWVHTVGALARGVGHVSLHMCGCIMTLLAFVREEILFFSASEVSVQGPWKIRSFPRQAKLSAILTGFEKECVCVRARLCSRCFAMESPSSTFLTFFLPPTHLLYTDFQQSPANHSLPFFSCLYLRHTACVAMVITDAPSPHNVSSCVGRRLNCGWWCRQTADVIISLWNKAYFYRWAQRAC